MKVLLINNQTPNQVNFGLYNRQIENSRKLVSYWKKKGFADKVIQPAMLKLENYKNVKADSLPIIDFIFSLFGKEKPVTIGAAKFPAIDFADIKSDRITKCLYKDIDIVKEDIVIPNILYSFAKTGIKMPLNKTFKTPLEVPVYTSTGTLLEPKSPMQVVKDIIKNYNVFEKQATAPHDYFAPVNGRIFANMKVSLD